MIFIIDVILVKNWCGDNLCVYPEKELSLNIVFTLRYIDIKMSF